MNIAGVPATMDVFGDLFNETNPVYPVNDCMQLGKPAIKNKNLIKTKITNVSDLTKEYAATRERNEKLKNENLLLLRDKQNFTNKRNLDFAKINKLELANANYKKSVKEQEENIQSQKIKLEENVKHIEQLEYKIKKLEEENKALDQDIETAKLKVVKKNPKIKIKHQDCQTLCVQKKDASVNTNIERKPIMANKNVWTDECITISKEPFPIFCSKCTAHIKPVPLDQIMKIMSSPPPVELSPLNSPKKPADVQTNETDTYDILNDTKDVLNDSLDSFFNKSQCDKLIKPIAPTKLQPFVAPQELKCSFMEIDKLRRQITKLKKSVKKIQIQKEKKTSTNNDCCSKNIQIYLQYPEIRKKRKLKPYKRLNNNFEKQISLKKNRWQIEDCSKSKREKIKGKFTQEKNLSKKKFIKTKEDDLFESPEVCIPNIESSAPNSCFLEDSLSSISDLSPTNSPININTIESMDYLGHESIVTDKNEAMSTKIPDETIELDLILENMSKNCDKREFSHKLVMPKSDKQLSSTKVTDTITNNLNYCSLSNKNEFQSVRDMEIEMNKRKKDMKDARNSNAYEKLLHMPKMQNSYSINSLNQIKSLNNNNENLKIRSSCLIPTNKVNRRIKTNRNTMIVNNLSTKESNKNELQNEKILFEENQDDMFILDKQNKLQDPFNSHLVCIEDPDKQTNEKIENVEILNNLSQDSYEHNKIDLQGNQLRTGINDILFMKENDSKNQTSLHIDSDIDVKNSIKENKKNIEAVNIDSFKSSFDTCHDGSQNNNAVTEINNSIATSVEQSNLENQTSQPILLVIKSDNIINDKSPNVEIANNSIYETSLELNKNNSKDSELKINNYNNDKDLLKNEISLVFDNGLKNNIDGITNDMENVNDLVDESSLLDLEENKLTNELIIDSTSKFDQDVHTQLDLNLSNNSNALSNENETLDNTKLDSQTGSFSVPDDGNNINVDNLHNETPTSTFSTNKPNNKVNKKIDKNSILSSEQENSITSLDKNDLDNISKCSKLKIQTSLDCISVDSAKDKSDEKLNDVEKVDKSSIKSKFMHRQRSQNSTNSAKPIKRSIARNNYSNKRLKIGLEPLVSVNNVDTGNVDEKSNDTTKDVSDFSDQSTLQNDIDQIKIKCPDSIQDYSNCKKRLRASNLLSNCKQLEVLTERNSKSIFDSKNKNDKNVKSISFEVNLDPSSSATNVPRLKQTSLQNKVTTIDINNCNTSTSFQEDIPGTRKSRKLNAINKDQSPMIELRSRQVIINKKNIKKKRLIKPSPCPDTIDSTNSCLDDSVVVSLLNECIFHSKHTKKFLKGRKHAESLKSHEKLINEQFDILTDNEYWTTEINEKVIKKLNTCDNLKIIALYAIEYVVNKEIENEELDKTYTPPAPMMTKFEQKFILFISSFNKQHPEFTNLFLEGIQYKLFRLGAPQAITTIERLFRLFLVLNKIEKDREKVRIAICDAFYCLKKRALDILLIAMSSWPEIFPHYTSNKDIIVKTIVHIVMTMKVEKAGNKLKSCQTWLSTVYEYPNSGYMLHELVQELLLGFRDNLPGVHIAILLLCKRMESDWSLKNIVPEIRLALVDQNNCPLMYQKLTLLGNIFRSFLTTNCVEMNTIIDELCDLLSENLGPDNLQEGIASCLLSISKFRYEDIAKCIIKWQFKKDLRPSTKDKLCSFFKDYNATWWWHFINRLPKE